MSRRIAPIAAVLLAILSAVALFAPGTGALGAAQEASPAAADCPETTEEENAALVRRLHEEVWEAGDLAVLEEVLADDFALILPAGTVLSMPSPNPSPGQGGLETAVRTLREDFPDLQITLDDIVVDGDTVAVRTTWSGTQADELDLWGSPNTGQPMERASAAFYRVACGQVVESWVLPDQLTMLRQLGIITDDELATAGAPTVATPAP